MREPQAADEIRAAGAVLWRPAGRGARVALVHRPKYDDWSFAKGKLEPGEHVLLAAVREVAEETGLAVTLGRRLQPVRYLSDGVPKRVDYWAAQADVAGPGFTPNAEIDEVSWVAASAASARLSYPHDVDTLADFRTGPRPTIPLILVRHAAAGRKSDWHSGDETRPLDGRGKKDARFLTLLLRCFGSGRVVSSPATRCVATVRPYARSVGADVEPEPAFLAVKSDRRPERDGGLAPDAAQAIGLLATADQPVVVCAHRENMPALLAGACAALGEERPPEVGKPLRKAEFLVLHRAGGRLAAVERYHVTGRG